MSLDIEREIANLERQLQHVREIKSRVASFPSIERDSELYQKLEAVEREIEDSLFRLRNLLKLKQVI